MVAVAAPVLGAVSRTCGWLLSANVELRAQAPQGATLLQLLTASLDEFSLSIVNAKRLLPFESFTLDGSNDLQFGWKLPALLAAPFWLLLARRLVPYLFLLLVFGPVGPRAGELSYDLLVREHDLNRGVWPRVLSWVLTTITSASLPGVALSLAESEAIGDTVVPGHVPASTCKSASVSG